MEYLIILGIVVVVVICMKKKVVVYEYEKALKYYKGKFVKILDPGKYWVLSSNVFISKVDIRPRFIAVPGQEVVSADGVTLKISLYAKYEIKDPYFAINKVDNFYNALYVTLQAALRQIVGNTNIDDLLAQRNRIGEQLIEITSEEVMEFGLNLLQAGVKDIMFPGELKKVFSQVVQARKEGLAALEKARGETAALRNLANAAKLLESNPALMKLKLLQSTGNTLVVGMTDNIIPVKATGNAKK